MDISGYLWVVAKDVMARLPFGFAQGTARQPGMGGWTKIRIKYRWKVPDTVGAYRIRPPHTNLNYYHLLIKETPRFSNSHPYNFQIPNP